MGTIGIVIPVYDGERFLAQTLRSVQAQTHTDWEAVVVDDGSADRSYAIARVVAARDPRVRVSAISRSGVSAARNHGVRLLSGRCTRVVFLDADDTWEEDTLGILTAELDARPDMLAVNGFARCTDVAGRLQPSGPVEAMQRRRMAITERGPVPTPADRPTTFAVLAWYPCILNGTILYWREAIEAVGLLDASLRWFEDWDLLLRLSLRGSIGFIDEPLLRYRRNHGTNVSSRPEVWRGLGEVRRKMLRLLRRDAERRRLMMLAQRYAHDRSANEQLGLAVAAVRDGRVLRGVRHLALGALGAARRLCLDAQLTLTHGRAA